MYILRRSANTAAWSITTGRVAPTTTAPSRPSTNPMLYREVSHSELTRPLLTRV